MPKLEDLQLQIKQTGAIQATNVGKLADNLQLLSAAIKSFPKGAANNLAEINAAIKSIDATKATAVGKLATALEKLGKKSSEVNANAAGNVAAIGAAIEQMIDSIDTTRLNSISEALTNFKSAVSELNGVKGSAKAAESLSPASAPKSMGDTRSPIDDMTPASDAMEKTAEASNEATESVSRFKEVLASIGKFGKTALASFTNGFKTISKTLAAPIWDNFKSKLNGIIGGVRNLVSSFGRIAMYRALRTAIKAITTGFSEGIKHVYQWSQLVGDSFVKSMDSMATSAHYLRDSLGAMASPLIDALAPAIEVLVEHFVTLLNVVNQFIAALTGKDTWRKAVRTPTTYSGAMEDAAKNTKKATKAQKELNKALQSFDELNLLTTNEINARKPTTPSSSTTPGVSSTEFKTKPIAKWIQDIKDEIEKGNWEGAGTLLAQKLNTVIAKWDAQKAGQKLGEKFQKAIDFYLGFMKNFKWEQLGIKSADFINGLLSKIKAKSLGEAIVQKFNAAIKFLKGFTKKFNWKSAGKWLADVLIGAFTGIDWASLGTLIKDLAGGILDMLEAGIKELWNSRKEILQKFGDFFSNLGWDGLGNIVKLGGIIIGFKALFSSLFTSTALSTSVMASLNSMLSVVAAGAKLAIVVALVWGVGGIIDNIKKYGVDKGLWRSLNVFSPEMTAKLQLDESSFTDSMKNLFGIYAPVFKALGIDLPSVDDTQSSYSKSATRKVQVLYETNSKAVMDEIKALDKSNPKVTVSFESNGYKKIVGYRNDLAKAITTKVTFKPVVETTDSKGRKSTNPIEHSQLKVLLDHAHYAEGGFPPQGSMFVAGEVPGQSEMVGTINGKTGVASGKEITGIADAVRDTGQTEAELLREQNNLLRRLLTKTGTVTLAPSAAAGRWVNQSQAAYARATGG